MNSFPFSLNLGTSIPLLATKTYLQVKTKTSVNTRQSKIFQIGMVHLVNSVAHLRDYLRSRILTSLVRDKLMQRNSTPKKLYKTDISSCNHLQDHLRLDLVSSVEFAMAKTYLRSSKVSKAEVKSRQIEEDPKPIANSRKQGLIFCRASSCQAIFCHIEAQAVNKHQ